jgi:hypothetical protein
MKTLSLPLHDNDVDTRRKRREACKLISCALYRLWMAEGTYRDRIPGNLANGCRYAYACKAADELLDAIVIVAEAFEPF